MGLCLYDMGHLFPALRSLQLCVRLDSQHTRAYSFLGYRLQWHGHRSLGSQLLRTAQESGLWELPYQVSNLKHRLVRASVKSTCSSATVGTSCGRILDEYEFDIARCRYLLCFTSITYLMTPLVLIGR